MIVLSDASPLINLSKLRQLPLLQVLFREVLVSAVVLEEALGHGHRPGTQDVAGAAYLRREASELDAVRYEEIRRSENLGSGEASTLASAERLRADLVLLDDRRAREAARRLGLVCIGSLRVMEMGFEAHAIGDLRLLYEDVIRQGLRIAPALLNQSLARYGFRPVDEASATRAE